MCPYFTPGLRPLTPTCHRDIPGERQLANDTAAAWKWFTSFSCFFLFFFAERLGFRRKCGSGVEIHLSRKRISISFRSFSFLGSRACCNFRFNPVPGCMSMRIPGSPLALSWFVYGWWLLLRRSCPV